MNEEFSNADEGSGQCAESVGESGSLRHGGHWNRDRHPGSDDGAQGEPVYDLAAGDEVGGNERADYGGEHVALGQEHSAASGLGVRHALERKDEEDRGDEGCSFHEVDGEGHFASLACSVLRLLNIFNMRSVMPKPPTTLMVAVVTAMNPRMCANSG